jgi:hypothetical protein
MSLRSPLVSGKLCLPLTWSILACSVMPVVADDAASAGARTQASPQIGEKVGPMTFTDIRFLPRLLSDLTSEHDRV